MDEIKFIDPSKIKIKYKQANDCKTFTATGATGGLNPQGEIICHFFVESSELPKDVRLNVDKQTGEIKELATETNFFIRTIQHTLVLRPQIARVIGSWLIDKSNDVDVAIKKIEEQKQK